MGVKKGSIARWKDSHKPFHWFCDFHRLIESGGFDAIIGNPPYIELKEITSYKALGYSCSDAGNLYALMMERCAALASPQGRLGFIVPVSSVSTDRYESLQKILSKKEHLVYSSFDDRPSRLFDGLEHIRLTVHIFTSAEQINVEHYSTRYNKWHTVFRSSLFKTLAIQKTSGSLVAGTMPKLFFER